jgi:uncharacterized protein
VRLLEAITVRKLGYSGNEIFRWSGQLVARDQDAVVVEARFNVTRVDLGYVVFERGDLFVEFYYWQRWFNVFQILASDGTLKGWYCNLASPPALVGDVLEYRDLALDLFVRPDSTWIEDDREEYDYNCQHLYTPDDVAAAEAGLAELRAWVERRSLPVRAAG